MSVDNATLTAHGCGSNTYNVVVLTYNHAKECNPATAGVLTDEHFCAIFY